MIKTWSGSTSPQTISVGTGCLPAQGDAIVTVSIIIGPSPNHGSWPHGNAKAAQATGNHRAQCQIQHIAAGDSPMASCQAQKICKQHRHETRRWDVAKWASVQKTWRDFLISSNFQPSLLFQANTSKEVHSLVLNELLCGSTRPPWPPCSPNHHVFSTAFDHGPSQEKTCKKHDLAWISNCHLHIVRNLSQCHTICKCAYSLNQWILTVFFNQHAIVAVITMQKHCLVPVLINIEKDQRIHPSLTKQMTKPLHSSPISQGKL